MEKIKIVKWFKEMVRTVSRSIDTVVGWWKYERKFFWQNILARVVVLNMGDVVGRDSLGEELRYGNICIVSDISYDYYTLGEEQLIIGHVGILNGKIGIIYVDSCCHICRKSLWGKDGKVNGSFLKLTDRVAKVFSNAGMGMTNILGGIGKVESENVEKIEEAK